MARRGRQNGGGAAANSDDMGDDLSAEVLASLLQDGYVAEEIADFYGMPVKRIRRFLRRHGIDEPMAGATAEPTSARARGGRAAERSDDAYSPWGDPGPPPSIGGASGARRAPRRLSAAQLDELCTLYLDPSLSIAEVASYFDLDPSAALELINARLTGIVPTHEG